MHRKDGQTTDCIYENDDDDDDVIKGNFGKEITDSTQGKSSECTGSDSVRNRSSRAAAVCLVLLCVLLLTAVIVLCVYIHTKSTNYTEERDRLLTNITRLTEERDRVISKNEYLTNERDQLISKNENLTNERNQLISKNENLTNERNQLISKNENLTNERNQLKSKNENLTTERNQLISKNENLTNERNQLISKNENLTTERNQLISKNENLTTERDQLRNHLQSFDGWTYYKSSFYYMPNETKNWNESRRDCREKGADLIIINNREEQDFVKNMTGKAVVWIGLTDSVEEGRWKWVDGTNMTSSFWGSAGSGAPPEPNGGSGENCVLTVAVPKLSEWPNLVGWIDVACTKAYQWICEKSISQLTLP